MSDEPEALAGVPRHALGAVLNLVLARGKGDDAAVRAAAVDLAELAPEDAVEARLGGLFLASAAAAAREYGHASLAAGHPARLTALGMAERLSRTAVALAEALDRHRGKGQQTVRVEHVHVHPGGQAIVGAVGRPGRGDGGENGHQPHASGGRGAEPDAPVRG